MTEIDYIAEELKKLLSTNKGLNEKGVVLSVFYDRSMRKENKELIRKSLSRLKQLKKENKKADKELRKIKTKADKALLSGNLSEEKREVLLSQLEKAQDLFKKLSEIRKDIEEETKKIKKLNKPILMYETNIWLTLFFTVFGVTSWFIANFLNKMNCCCHFWVFLGWLIGIILFFIIWKIIYLRYYCKQIHATKQISIIVYSLKLTNAFLLALIPYFTFCAYLNVNGYFFIVPILIVFSVKMGASIYDFLSASKFFDSTENIVTLLISILIAVVFGILSIDNIFISLIVKMLLVIISLGLTVLILKKCMLDKVTLENINAIYNFVVLLLATILVSCLAIYFITWNKEPNAEQTLFSAVMGIYAAVLGGAITLGGVAWGIRNEAKNRNDDAKQRENERKEEERKKAKPIFIYHYLYDCQIPKKEYMTIVDIKSKGDIWTVAQFINSDNSNFIIKSVYFDDEWNDTFINNVVIKNQALYLVFMTKGFADDWKNRKVILKVEDSIGQYHYYSLWYVKQKGKSEEFNTLHSFQEITEEEIPNV